MEYTRSGEKGCKNRDRLILWPYTILSMMTDDRILQYALQLRHSRMCAKYPLVSEPVKTMKNLFDHAAVMDNHLRGKIVLSSWPIIFVVRSYTGFRR